MRKARKHYTAAEKVAILGRRLIGRYVEHNKTVRSHSAIGLVKPADLLADRRAAIHAVRERKLEAARERRRSRALAA